MFRIVLPTLLGLLVLLVGQGFLTSRAAEQPLTVTITGFRSQAGKVHVVVFDQAKGFPTQPGKALTYKVASIPSKAGVTLSLPIAKSGPLAVAAYHDENGNGKMDANLLGIPTEGTGASNNAKSPFGPPKFQDAQFLFPQKSTIRFVMEY